MACRALALLLLSSLAAGCGDSDLIRLRLADGSRSFTQPTVERTQQGEVVQLRVCGRHELSPSLEDTGSSLCAVVQLDAPALEGLAGDAVLRIEGSAVAPADVLGPQAPFEPGGDHAPEVLAAWVYTSCFAPPLPASIQQVRGELRFEERSDERWRGQLELHVEGAPGGDACAVGAQGADFDVRFDVR
jgi:hypothetical protein